MPRYVISARRIRRGVFIAEPGPISFLRVPDDAETLLPDHIVKGRVARLAWSREVQGLADGDENPNSISPAGDILVLVHGYNNAPPAVLASHKHLEANLRAEGWRGLVISFDWPSNNQVLNYLEDRSDGAAVALELVRQCVKLLKDAQEAGCETNIHLIAHSAGAYVAMEAFAQADKDGELFKSPWRIGQVAFISADVSSASLAAADQWSNPMFRRVMRLTNYVNPFDAVLAVSNAKRLGTAARAGRVGLPASPNPKAVDVDCGQYFTSFHPAGAGGIGWTHSWYFASRVFARDLAMTLEGAIDRNAIPTRRREAGGRLVLQDEPRPVHMAAWAIKESVRRTRRI
jgi:pimeloyl-ACP methyl ester carboxylesterase